MRLMLAGVFLVALLPSFEPLAAQSGRPLTNQDIIDMTKAGLSEATIVKAIETSADNFQTGPQDLIALRNSAVSDKVLSAMLVANKVEGEPTRSLEEVGLYAVKGGMAFEVGAEIFNYRKGGGAAEKFFTGFEKEYGYTNGVVNVPHSATIATPPLDFLLITVEGITPSEYLLVKLDEKGNHREFRQETTHLFSKSTGPGPNTVEFKFDKTAPHAYRIHVGDLSRGEYGFLPPLGLDNKNAQAVGRIFTFSIK